MSAVNQEQILEMPVYLTTAELAKVTKVAPSTLCRWRQRGEGPQVTWLSSTCPRYRWEDVAAWLRKSAA